MSRTELEHLLKRKPTTIQWVSSIGKWNCSSSLHPPPPTKPVCADAPAISRRDHGDE
jgi:hypothetical protein